MEDRTIEKIEQAIRDLNSNPQCLKAVRDPQIEIDQLVAANRQLARSNEELRAAVAALARLFADAGRQ